MIPAAEWKPDLGPLEPTSTDFVMNVIPVGNGWKSFPDLSAISVALPTACVGGCYYRTISGNHGVIAGTKTKLYKLSTVAAPHTWTDISGGQTFDVPTDNFWQFERFGNNLYACSLGAPLQVLDVEGGTNFGAAPGSPPRSKYIRTIGDFLLLANLKVGATEYPTKWANSGINDATVWTAGTKLADDQVIADGDEITALLGGPGGGRIIQLHAKRQLQLTSDVNMAIKQVDIDKTHGAVAPYGTVQMPGGNYIYLEHDGFFMGDDRQPISAERVSRTFIDRVDNIAQVQGVADPLNHMAWWRYSASGVSLMIGWDWDTNRWTQANPATEFLMASVGTSLTMDQLNAVFLANYGSSSLDTVGIPSLDSAQWKGGTPLFAAFGTDHKLANFTGQPRMATVDTTAQLLKGMKRSKVIGGYPLADSSSWQMALAIGNRVGDVSTNSFGPYANQNAYGRCPLRGNGKLVRFRAQAPAGTEWDHFHGVEPEIAE
jgi:hypothetical protein